MKRSLWSIVQTACLNTGLAIATFVSVSFSPLVAQAQVVPPPALEGYSLLNKGLVNQAIDQFQRAVQQYPQSVAARLGLAIAYRRAGQDANAFQAYEQVLRLEPNNRLALQSLGLLGGYRPEWQNRGIAALTTLLQLNPEDPEALTQRALLYRYQGRFTEALADYQRLLQKRPSPEVMLGAAEAYSYNGNYRQALEWFNRYQQTGQRLAGYPAVAYARALRNTGNVNAAIQLLEPQLSASSSDLDTQIRVELAQAYVANQQTTKALAILDPLRDRPGTALSLARALNEMGQQSNNAILGAEAAQLYRQVLNQTSNPSPSFLQEIADVLGTQPSERPYALQIYRQLAQTQPDDREIQLKRLALERQLGYISRLQLRQSLSALLNPLPADPQQQQAIAQGLARLEAEPELLPLYLSLLQNPAVNEPFLSFRVAQILLQRNDRVGARNALAVYTATPQAAGDLAPQLLAADIERREGNLDAAARRYGAIIATNPANEDILIGAVQGLANIQVAQGRTREALLLYDPLIARNPQNWRLHLARTQLAYQAGLMSSTQAETVLQSWLVNRPPTDTPPELYSLISTLPANPRLETLYTQLAEEDPSHIPTQVRLVEVLRLRDPELARSRAMQLVARSQTLGLTPPEVYLLQGRLALAIADYKLAESSFQSALTLQPSNPDALVGLADTRYRQRLFEQAETLYNQALALKPADLDIKRSLIETKVAQDYPQEALYQLEQLQNQQPNANLANRQQKIEEDFLQRRGFQPPWERY